MDTDFEPDVPLIRQRAGMVVGLVFLSLLAPAGALAHDVPLWVTRPGPCPTDPLTPVAPKCSIVEVDRTALTSATGTLLLELPDGTTAKAVRDQIVMPNTRPSIWHGSVEGEPRSSVTFSNVRGTVVGVISIDGRMYRLRLISAVQIVEVINPLLIPEGSEPVSYPPPAPPPPPPPSPPPSQPSPPEEDIQDQCETDSPNRVDVLVVYSPAAMAAAGGRDGMSAWIELQEFESNLSYILSNAAMHVRVTRYSDINYTEPMSNYESLAALTQGDGVLASAHQWRNDYQADAVVLITLRPGTSTSGVANAMRDYHVPDDNFESFAPLAFAVVEVGGFLTSTFTFAHELGHVLGAQHNSDASDSVTTGAIPESSFGHMDETPKTGCNSWMTIMAIRESISGQDPGKCAKCLRVPYWSSDDPLVSWCGEPVGNKYANNRKTLNLTAPIVSKFRCGSPVPPNVWLKDTWEDTGAEPDPAQAASDMWKSPYIWARLERDEGPGFKEQHHHESPVQGEKTFLYAKLHNGGVTANGSLEFWVASASTSLTWPQSFDLVGIAPVAAIARNETRIVEIPEPWIPETSGHFSFLARWVSATDPMTFPESLNVDANVRGNNNLVLRSVNPLTLSPSAGTITVRLTVENPGNIQAKGSLIVKPSDRNPEHSFLKAGGITIKMDSALATAWQRGRYSGEGFRRIGNSLQITNPRGAKLENIHFEPRARMSLSIEFERTRDTLSYGSFFVDVIQMYEEGAHSRVVGGVTYELVVPGH